MYDVYMIQEGDTVSSIANKYNVTPYILYQLNGNNLDNLTVGKSIIVPNIANSYFDYYTIKQGDTLYKIANNYGVTVQELMNLNNLATTLLNIGDTILIPKQITNF